MKHICIKPILKCNCNCSTCSARTSLHKNVNSTGYIPLTLSEYDKIFYDLSRFNNGDRNSIKISISGGEPMLYHDIYSLVKLAKKYTDYIVLDSNASLLNTRSINKLITSGISHIYVSFMDTDVHRYNDNRGTKFSDEKFSDMRKNMKYLNAIAKAAAIKVKNVVILTNDRLLNMNNIINMSEELGFSEISLDFLEACFIDSSKRPTVDDVDKFETEILPKIDNKHRNTFEYVCTILRKENYRDSIGNPDCCIPGNFCIILANGDVHQCNIIEYSHELHIGNIRLKSLYDIYKDYIPKKSAYCQYCPINMEKTLVI